MNSFIYYCSKVKRGLVCGGDLWTPFIVCRFLIRDWDLRSLRDSGNFHCSKDSSFLKLLRSQLLRSEESPNDGTN